MRGKILSQTPILMSDGTTKLVEQLVVGDVVKSFTSLGMIDESQSNWMEWTTTDPQSGSISETTVVNISSEDVDQTVYTLNETLMFGESVYFLSLKNGTSEWKWTIVSELSVGDKVLNSSLQEISIESITSETSAVETFSVDVESRDNFFASDILVHNAYTLSLISINPTSANAVSGVALALNYSLSGDGISFPGHTVSLYTTLTGGSSIRSLFSSDRDPDSSTSTTISADFSGLSTGTYYVEFFWKTTSTPRRAISITGNTSRTLSFNANGGTGTMTDQSFTSGVAFNIKANSYTRAGYTFGGWGTFLGDTTANYSNQQPVTFTNNTTLYAVWTPITYSVRYNPNGGTGSATTQTGRTYDVSFNLTSLSTLGFSRTGYTFLGWSTNSSAVNPTYSDGELVNNLTSTNNATVDLFAIWSDNSTKGIIISESPTYTVSASLNSNAIVLSAVNPNLVVGMLLIYVSGGTVWQSGTEIIGISYGISNTTLTLSKHATGSFVSVIKFGEKNISLGTVDDGSLTTDKNYSRGSRGDRVFEFKAVGGWTGGFSHTLVSGRLYKFIDVVGDTFSEYGTVYDTQNGLYISNGVQPSSSVFGFVSFKFMPVISNSMASSFTRISIENNESYADIIIQESKLPIFVGGSTSDSYRLKLINPNAITRGRVTRYVVLGGSTSNFSTISNIIRRSSISSNGQCYIAMSGGGGGGASGRGVFQDPPAGGGGGGWRLFRTYFPGIWTSLIVGTGGATSALDVSTAASSGGETTLQGSGGNSIKAGGGTGASWNGNADVAGSGGSNSETGTTISLYRTSISDVNGATGGINSSDGKGFNGSVGATGIPVTAMAASHFGNLFSNSNNNFFYNLYAENQFGEYDYINNGPLSARNGGDGISGAGNGSGGGASAYANGGRGATSNINATGGTYGSGGGGGRSGTASDRKSGGNGGSGIVLFFS
jgi:uncharacterized repeat protein (TIGR02543 family)